MDIWICLTNTNWKRLVHRVSAWEGRWYQPFDLRCSIFQAFSGRFPNPPPKPRRSYHGPHLMVDDGSARWVSNTSSLRTVILVNLALHLQRCGIKWQQPSRAAGSGVISVASLTNSLQIQDYVCSSLVRPWDQLTYDAQGRRLGWNIAVVAEQISREYLPQRAPVRTSFTGPAPEGQTSHKIAHLNGEGHPVAFG